MPLILENLSFVKLSSLYVTNCNKIIFHFGCKHQHPAEIQLKLTGAEFKVVCRR